MLYIALLIALAFYGALYLLWNSVQPQVQPHMERSTPVLLWLRDMIFQAPDSSPLLLLKTGIALLLFYLVADALLWGCKRLLRARPSRFTVYAPSSPASLPEGAAPQRRLRS